MVFTQKKYNKHLWTKFSLYNKGRDVVGATW